MQVWKFIETAASSLEKSHALTPSPPSTSTSTPAFDIQGLNATLEQVIELRLNIAFTIPFMSNISDWNIDQKSSIFQNLTMLKQLNSLVSSQVDSQSLHSASIRSIPPCDQENGICTFDYHILDLPSSLHIGQSARRAPDERTLSVASIEPAWG